MNGFQFLPKWIVLVFLSFTPSPVFLHSFIKFSARKIKSSVFSASITMSSANAIMFMSTANLTPLCNYVICMASSTARLKRIEEYWCCNSSKTTLTWYYVPLIYVCDQVYCLHVRSKLGVRSQWADISSKTKAYSTVIHREKGIFFKNTPWGPNNQTFGGNLIFV